MYCKLKVGIDPDRTPVVDTGKGLWSPLLWTFVYQSSVVFDYQLTLSGSNKAPAAGELYGDKIVLSVTQDLHVQLSSYLKSETDCV